MVIDATTTIEDGEVPKPVGAVREWMAEVIIANGFCPPLAHYLNKCKQEGITDWAELSEYVEIVDFFNEEEKQEIIQNAAKKITNFIVNAGDETAPATLALIFPDLESNLEFDTVVKAIKLKTLELLLQVEDIGTIAHKHFVNVRQQDGEEIYTLNEILSQYNLQTFLIMSIVEGAFNPAHFYARNLDDTDLANFISDRGDLNRQKVLSRAPCNILQIVNRVHPNNRRLTAPLNNELGMNLVRRNTEIAEHRKKGPGILKRIEQIREKYLGPV